MHKRMRTALFVPGTRPERFSKALAAGADAVIIDLEDSVEQQNKAQARENIAEFAAQNPESSFLVRVNDAGTSWFEDDLDLCRRVAQVASIVLPKAETAEQVRHAGGGGHPVMPIVESAKGVLALAALAAAPGVDRLSFGSLDLMLDLGTTPDTLGAGLLLDQVRCEVLLQSRAHGIKPPLDGVHPDFSDHHGLAQIARQVCDMGFGGMLCIHPTQVGIIHTAFAPTAADVRWAQRVVETAESTGASAFKLDGSMVDVPVIERARRILERS